MRKLLWFIVCLMTMVVSANAHNVHYPTYTEDGITYVKEPLSTHYENGEWMEWWSVQKVDKPDDKTITIPYIITINGEKKVIWGIKENAFAPCASLDSLIISDGILLDTSPNAFKGCKEFEYLYYSNSGGGGHNRMYTVPCKTLETVKGVGEKPFWQAIAGSLEKLIIKDTKSLRCTFNLCKNLKTIICYAEDAPNVRAADGNTYSCEDEKFSSKQWGTITLYVPRESLEKYYFHRVWGEIDNIYTIDEMVETPTSINSTTNSITMDGAWYSLNGIKVDKPTKGVYIKNGKKYIVK